jgi:tripartite-type tricarboxylate transporter receptor subunit TctC
MTSWAAVCGPARLPGTIIERLSALARQVLCWSPELIRGFGDLGAANWWATPEDTAAFRAREAARLAPVIRASGTQVD